MTSLKTQVALQVEDDPTLSPILRRYAVIAAPLVQNGRAVGCLVLAEHKKWLPLEAEVGFVEGLAMLFATQLELSHLEEQQRLLQKAEFLRLQSQVNPHFLFNALNTIACFCREKPDRPGSCCSFWETITAIPPRKATITWTFAGSWSTFKITWPWNRPA